MSGGIKKQRRAQPMPLIFDYWSGYAVIERVFDTSPLGVQLNREGSGNLDSDQCRRLAGFLNLAADWLDNVGNKKQRRGEQK